MGQQSSDRRWGFFWPAAGDRRLTIIRAVRSASTCRRAPSEGRVEPRGGYPTRMPYRPCFFDRMSAGLESQDGPWPGTMFRGLPRILERWPAAGVQQGSRPRHDRAARSISYMQPCRTCMSSIARWHLPPAPDRLLAQRRPSHNVFVVERTSWTRLRAPTGKTPLAYRMALNFAKQTRAKAVLALAADSKVRGAVERENVKERRVGGGRCLASHPLALSGVCSLFGAGRRPLRPIRLRPTLYCAYVAEVEYHRGRK